MLEVHLFDFDEDLSLYRATWATTPPVLEDVGAFHGVYRSMLLIDCHKSVPDIANNWPAKLPAEDFVAQLEDALGTKLIEAGWIH